jgi:DegV family protein with EDD domain
MGKIAVVTDSNASLPPEIIEQHGIYQVPINIHFEDQQFEAGVTIDDEALFSRVDEEKRLPTTSAPSPARFDEVFRRAFNDGAEAVLCFTVSSEVSATYAAALNGARMSSNRTIEVIDTHSLSLGQGFMVLAAVEALQAGASLEEAAARARRTGQQTYLFAALATLRYLAMSGRVGHLTAGVADLFNVKPLLTIREGKLEMLERVRTRRKAQARLLTLAAEAMGQRSVVRMGVVHVADRQAALDLEAQLRINLPVPQEILITELSPGLSVHTGAGLVGVSFVLAEPQA